jgi:hypothetical protein
MTPLEYRLGHKPLIRLALEALISILVRTSTIILKSSGERGSLFLRPLLVRKKLPIIY